MALPPQPSRAARAFPTHPRTDRYFPAECSEAARQRLHQCLVRGDGPALLLGAPGVGKTMLLEALAAELEDACRVVRLAGGQLCTRRALLQAILHGLGLPYRDRDEGELRLALADELSDTKNEPRPVALLIDEAQTLPVRLLEELRLLSNQAVQGTPRLRLVLAGSHALDEALTAPELEALNQRIAARCYLEPLNRDEATRYLRAHLAAAGRSPDSVLAADAYDAFWRASDGLPRLLNQVAERALQLADESNRPTVDADTIGEAWSDMHQLAAPWQSPAGARLAAASAEAPSGSTVEFGALDEDDEFGQALQAEAEAVTGAAAATASVGPDEAVWNADAALDRVTGRLRLEPEPHEPIREAAADADEDAADHGELVSYAFPSVHNQADNEPRASVVENDPANDEESATPDAVTRAADPFDEPFDEEEIVLDPQCQLERVIPPAPTVVAIEPTEVGLSFSQSGDTELDAIGDEDGSTAAGGFQEEEPAVIAVEDAATSETASTADGPGFYAPDDDPIVLVEADEPTSLDSAAAHRQDYRQLFATLRHG